MAGLGTQLKEILPINTLLSQGTKTIKKRFLQKLISFVQSQIGGELLFSPPPSLLNAGIEAEEPLRVAKRLKQAGIPLSGPHFFHGHPDEPSITRISFDRESGASNFFNLTQCMWSALAECTERRIWKYIPWYGGLVRYGTFTEMGTEAINPLSIVSFSEKQKNEHRNIQIEPSDSFGWIRVKSLKTDGVKWAPLQLYSVHYWQHHARTQEKMLRWPITTGLATGQNLTDAIFRGALEVIERDAFMITYLNKLSVPKIDLESLKNDPEFASILTKLERYKVEPHFLYLPTDFPVHVIAAALTDSRGGAAFTIGAKADFDLKKAMIGALSEALAVRLGYKNSEPIPDDFPFHKMGQAERIRYWLNPTRFPQIAFMVEGPTISFADALNKVSSPSSDLLEQIRHMLELTHTDMFYVDCTTPAVTKASDLKIAFVMSPELQPLYLAEEIPAMGGDRLSRIPTKFGYTPAQTLNRFPHPFP